MSSPSREDGLVLSAEEAEHVAAIGLALLRLRAAYVIGKALAERYVEAEHLQAVLASRPFMESAAEFGSAMGAVAEGVDERLAKGVSPVDAIQAGAYDHQLRVTEAVTALAEVVGIPPTEVVATFLMGG